MVETPDTLEGTRPDMLPTVAPPSGITALTKRLTKEYLGRYVVRLLQKHIVNAAAMRKIAEKIEAVSDNRLELIAEERSKLQDGMDSLTEAIGNITTGVCLASCPLP